MRASDQVAGVVVLGLLVGMVAGCAAGHPTGGGGSAVTVTFTGGTPLAVATQVGGTGAFTTITPGNHIAIPVSAGANIKYAIAYVCPPVPGLGNTVSSEFVIEATTQDSTAFTVSCLGSPSTGTATGSASSSIAGTTDIRIRGNQGFGANVGSASGSFSATMPVGTNDVAAIAVDGSGNVLGVKMVRSQTVPGAINGGTGIILVPPGDSTTPQTLNVTNVPAGFVTPPAAAVEYLTANGTSILLDNNSATSYPAVPTAATQSGDFYLYESNSTDTATHNSAVGVTQTTTTGGGTATISLPAPWSFAGPAAAAFPTFTFSYTGFSGLAAISDQAEIEWAPTATTLNTIQITATSSFLSGTNTLAIPDLTALAGFIATAPHGQNVFWVADINGGTAQVFTFFANLPANGSLSFVQNRGMFTEP
jgi:hypothetical protein